MGGHGQRRDRQRRQRRIAQRQVGGEARERPGHDVDTFEPEQEIDLAAVTAEIKQLDASTGDIDSKIAKYTQELGIESPF